MSLIDSLQNSILFDHLVTEFKVIETHISWVLLTGQYVYKIKKPVNFGFLDFSTLEKRRFYCKEELRLNRRLAPGLYLDVVTINGSEECPEINGHGLVLEYAVKMQQFPQSAQLDRILAKHGLNKFIMDKLAGKVARFHLTMVSSSKDICFGDVKHVRQAVLDNYEHIRSSIDDQTISLLLDKLEYWSKQQLVQLVELIQQRKVQGFVRECHGDMHLRNIALWNDDIIIFDCIEFNKMYYQIDVMSDISFMVMDLEVRQQRALAIRFLNSYLQITGDFEGLRLLRFYKVYRAMVRAKVAALRAYQEQSGSQEYEQIYEEFLQYITLAERCIHPTTPCLLINHGLSGAGKSVGTTSLLEKYPAIQIRSDVERKRMFQGKSESNSSADIGQGLYTPEVTSNTYSRMKDIAQCLLKAGYSVVIDAANLKNIQRFQFIELAKSMNLPCFILHYRASVETLRKRVKLRAEQGSDVSDATLEVLEHQIDGYVSLSYDEKPYTIEIDTEKDIDIEAIIIRIQGGHDKK